MTNIVVGVDGSDNARHALEWAAAEAALRGARLDIVSTWEFPMLIASEVVWATPPESALLIVAAAERAQRLIDETHLTDTKVSFAIITPEGRAGAELVRLSSDADMLVVGSRGAGSAREMLLGSVSNYCVHHATCPIVIIRPPA
jgi:nucleotide-binding universal stress UspA family protein